MTLDVIDFDHYLCLLSGAEPSVGWRYAAGQIPWDDVPPAAIDYPRSGLHEGRSSLAQYRRAAGRVRPRPRMAPPIPVGGLMDRQVIETAGPFPNVQVVEVDWPHPRA